MRYVNHLLRVEGWSARVIRDCIHGRRRCSEPQPVRGFTLRIQFHAVVSLATLGFKTLIARATGGQKLSGPEIVFE